jgi:hypothetical protein
MIVTATNTTTSFRDDWAELYQLDQPLDMEAFLQSNLLAAKRNTYMFQSIAHMVTGSISFIASMLLIIHILRSHDGLSTTYHRLIFGLSACDIISSFAFALSSTMVPKEMSYLVPFARGNIMTCDAQGFLIFVAVIGSLFYNCSICFYYLAIITYNKNYDYIREKLEPWFHGISILAPLASIVIMSITRAFNGPDGGTCYGEPYTPPHCIGYEVGEIPRGYSISCGRGSKNDDHAELRNITLLTGNVITLVIAPVIIVVSMIIMYRSVRKIEKQIQNYGVGALRLRTRVSLATPADNSDYHQETNGVIPKIKRRFGKFMCLKRTRKTNITKSNAMKSQKRAVLHMAIGYAGAWLLVWYPVAAFYFPKAFADKDLYSAASDTTLIMLSCMQPLQGFFNFLVFMAPKVRNIRTMTIRGGTRQD